MCLKRLLALLCSLALVFCLVPSTAFASGGNGNIDGGGGGMGQGTSSNFWNPGNDGVRITVVDAASGAAVSSPLDFSNRTQKSSILHFGKVNKLQYLSGTGLSLQSGVAYSCIKPAQSMPTIVSSKGQSNIDAIKRYFCSEYACMMVAQAAGVDYEQMIAGEYKLLIEPIAYFTHNGQYYCMTATEAGLYDQMSGGNLRRTMTSLTHKNLPLSMFLEFSDLGISAWTGNTTGTQNNSDIINTLGVGIVWFDEAPPEGDIEAPDVEYRVDTDVITSVTLRTDTDLTPDNPASVTFHILGTTYRVNNVVIPAGDSQVVWVKWHTPTTPQTVTITVSVSGAYTAQDTFVAEIVDLNEHIPPDPVATDTNPGYTVPSLPNETQKLTANWGVWSCYWVPVWVWCDHGEDGGHWVDEGYWEYEYTGYCHANASLRPASVVYGLNRRSQGKFLYLCDRWPACDAYVSAHDRTHRPMGTLANGDLRHKRILAHRALEQLRQSRHMEKWEVYIWLQAKLGLDKRQTHIGQFSEWMCDEVVRLCRQASTPPAAGQAAA